MHSFFRRDDLRFLAVFFGVFGLGYALLLLFPPVALEHALANWTARVLGLPSAGNRIVVDEGVFVVNESCTGLLSGLMLAGIVFGAGMGRIRKKAAIALFGAALLFGLNMIRLLLVVGVGRSIGLDAAEIVHVASWFGVSLAVIALAWMLLSPHKKIGSTNAKPRAPPRIST